MLFLIYFSLYLGERIPGGDPALPVGVHLDHEIVRDLENVLVVHKVSLFHALLHSQARLRALPDVELDQLTGINCFQIVCFIFYVNSS